jgi:hypothetical protein
VHVRDDEEEVTNVKRMHIGEEEVSMSRPVTVVVPWEEEKVPIPQGLCRLPAEEEDAPVLLERPPPPSWSHQRKNSRSASVSRSRRGKKRSLSYMPPLSWSHRKEGDALSPIDVNGPVLPLVSSSPFFFLKNVGDSSRSFSHTNAVDL